MQNYAGVKENIAEISVKSVEAKRVIKMAEDNMKDFLKNGNKKDLLLAERQFGAGNLLKAQVKIAQIFNKPSPAVPK